MYLFFATFLLKSYYLRNKIYTNRNQQYWN